MIVPELLVRRKRLAKGSIFNAATPFTEKAARVLSIVSMPLKLVTLMTPLSEVVTLVIARVDAWAPGIGMPLSFH